MTKFWLKYPRFYDYIQIIATGGFLARVAQALPKMEGKMILDLGCGTGNLLYYIKPKYYLGLDINRKFIKLARNKFPKSDFETSNLVKDRLPDVKFDYVFIMNVLHHLTDSQVLGLFRKLKRWRKAGKLLIVESQPVGVVGNLLEGMDAGENFRDFGKLTKLVRKVCKISLQKTVVAPLGTYKYLILSCDV